MLYAQLTVACPSKGEAETVSQHPDQCKHSRIDGRLSVLDACVERGVFDSVQLQFRGIILSSVGYHSAIEDIITLADVKTSTDFKSSQPDTDSDSRHVDFHFQLPSHVTTADSALRSLPLTTTITGSTTSASPRGGLNDHQFIAGDCEVSYWVEAQFCRAGVEVGFLCKHVKLTPSLYPRLCVSLSPKSNMLGVLPLTLRAKPDLFARWGLQKKSPKLDVTLYEPDIIIEHSGGGQRQITLPVAVTMDIIPESLDARQSFKCAVEARWEVTTRFSAFPMRSRLSDDRKFVTSDTICKVNTTPTQKSCVLFRPLPLYDDDADARRLDSYVATSQLELAVPDAISQPSVSWRHLTRTYTLHLSLDFHGLQGAPRYSLRSQIPVSVSASACVDGPKTNNAHHKDGVVVGVRDVEDSHNNNRDLHDVTAPLLLADHVQRMFTRTPPPLYFR